MWHHRRMRARGARLVSALVLAVTLALILAGCFQARVQLTVAADGTVDGTIHLAYDRAVLERLDRDPADAQREVLDDLADDAPDGQMCASWQDADSIGAECELTDVALADLSRAEAFDQRLTILDQGDQLVLTAVIDLDEVPANDPELIATFDARVEVTFPGEVLESNGQVQGTTVVWRPEPGAQAQLHAVARAASAGEATPPAASPIWPFVAAALVVLLIAGVILADLTQRPRRPRGPTPA
jgi:hypothetical protein